MKAFLCTLLWLLLTHASNATITLLDTGETYGSVQDASLGKRLWRGYTYMAHLQYVVDACDPDVYYNITVPDDGLPVAVIVRSISSNTCSTAQKAKHILKNAKPSGLVKYMIVDGDDEYASSIDVPFSIDDEDIPLYILHISARAHWDLLEHLVHQTVSSRLSGGPRVTIDSRTSHYGGISGLWIGLSALVSVCCCTFLLVLGGQAWIAPSEQTPVRQGTTRRRLTRDQVRETLPQYRYDGSVLYCRREDELGDQQVLDASQFDMTCCSVCLDDYEAGDKLRILPCNHVFHSKCVGRWLSERSATCPLCKDDLWVEEEEEQDDEEATTQRDDSWLPRLVDRLFHDQNEAEVPLLGAEQNTSDNRDLSARPSWWQRWLPNQVSRLLHEPSTVETTTVAMLSEPLLRDEEIGDVDRGEPQGLESEQNVSVSFEIPETFDIPDPICDAESSPPRQVSI
jgi:hypothetical protein